MQLLRRGLLPREPRPPERKPPRECHPVICNSVMFHLDALGRSQCLGSCDEQADLIFPRGCRPSSPGYAGSLSTWVLRQLRQWLVTLASMARDKCETAWANCPLRKGIEPFHVGVHPGRRFPGQGAIEINPAEQRQRRERTPLPLATGVMESAGGGDRCSRQWFVGDGLPRRTPTIAAERTSRKRGARNASRPHSMREEPPEKREETGRQSGPHPRRRMLSLMKSIQRFAAGKRNHRPVDSWVLDTLVRILPRPRSTGPDYSRSHTNPKREREPREPLALACASGWYDTAPPVLRDRE